MKISVFSVLKAAITFYPKGYEDAPSLSVSLSLSCSSLLSLSLFSVWVSEYSSAGHIQSWAGKVLLQVVVLVLGSGTEALLMPMSKNPKVGPQVSVAWHFGGWMDVFLSSPSEPLSASVSVCFVMYFSFYVSVSVSVCFSPCVPVCLSVRPVSVFEVWLLAASLHPHVDVITLQPLHWLPSPNKSGQVSLASSLSLSLLDTYSLSPPPSSILLPLPYVFLPSFTLPVELVLNPFTHTQAHTHKTPDTQQLSLWLLMWSASSFIPSREERRERQGERGRGERQGREAGERGRGELEGRVRTKAWKESRGEGIVRGSKTMELWNGRWRER